MPQPLSQQHRPDDPCTFGSQHRRCVRLSQLHRIGTDHAPAELHQADGIGAAGQGVREGPRACDELAHRRHPAQPALASLGRRLVVGHVARGGEPPAGEHRTATTEGPSSVTFQHRTATRGAVLALSTGALVTEARPSIHLTTPGPLGSQGRKYAPILAGVRARGGRRGVRPLGRPVTAWRPPSEAGESFPTAGVIRVGGTQGGWPPGVRRRGDDAPGFRPWGACRPGP